MNTAVLCGGAGGGGSAGGEPAPLHRIRRLLTPQGGGGASGGCAETGWGQYRKVGIMMKSPSMWKCIRVPSV